MDGYPRVRYKLCVPRCLSPGEVWVQEGFELAGFALGHAIALSSGSRPLVPFAMALRRGERQMLRFTDDDPEVALQSARVAVHSAGAGPAVILYQGFVDIAGDPSHAVLAELWYGQSEPITVAQVFSGGEPIGSPIALGNVEDLRMDWVLMGVERYRAEIRHALRRD